MAVNHVINIAIYIQAAAAWLFIIEYQRRTRGAWRRRVIGWHVMALTFADALFATELTIVHIWPWLAFQPAFRWSIALVFLAGSLITAWRLWILVLVQQRDEPVKDPPDPSNPRPRPSSTARSS